MVYLLIPFLFLPGFFLGWLLKLFEEKKSITEVLAISVGLSLIFDTLFLFVHSQIFEVGISWKLILPLLFWITFLGVVVLVSRPKPNIKITKTDAYFGILLLYTCAILALHFLKYPLFPEYDSQDAISHAEITTTLLQHPIALSENILYYGIHYILALGTVLSNESAYFAARYTMGLLALLSPLWLFYACSNLFHSERAALFISGIYVLTGTLWFGMVFSSGLYPTFYAILLSLFLIGAVANLTEKSSKENWFVYLFALAGASLSHYSILLAVPAIMAFIMIKGRQNIQNMFLMVPILFAGIGTLLFPQIISLLSSVYSGSSFFSFAPTYLSSATSSFPSLSLLIGVMQNDIQAVILLALFAGFLYLLKQKKIELLLPLIWFFTILIVAPQNNLSWRFSFLAILSLYMMAGYTLHIVTLTKKAAKYQAHPKNYYQSLAILLIIIPSMAHGSWTAQARDSAITDTQTFAQIQHEEYEAMKWMGQQKLNGNGTPTFISVTDWRFRYANFMIGNVSVIVNYQDMSGPSNAAFDAVAKHAHYFIVTNITQYPFDMSLTNPGFQVFFNQLNPFLTFNIGTLENSQLAYSSPNVHIFCVHQSCKK